MTKRTTKTTAKQSKPMTAKQLDDTVGNVVSQLEVAVIADELKAGAVIGKKT
jgi:hypothetical protein